MSTETSKLSDHRVDATSKRITGSCYRYDSSTKSDDDIPEFLIAVDVSIITGFKYGDAFSGNAQDMDW